MSNKYDYFFKSIKDFIIKLDLIHEEKKMFFFGNSSYDFKSFFNKKTSKAITSYLKYFGKGIEFKNNGIGNALFDFASISSCSKLVEGRNIENEILEVEFVTGWEESAANFENKELLFLKCNTSGSSYLFGINSEENPVMYVYWEGGEISSDNNNFTSFVRDTVFWELLRLVKKDSTQQNRKILKIGWIKFYEFLFENHRNIRSKIVGWRYEFNRLSLKKQRGGIFWGVDEYEIDFIKYILEEKKINYDLLYFNPYTYNETFEKYLL